MFFPTTQKSALKFTNPERDNNRALSFFINSQVKPPNLNCLITKYSLRQMEYIMSEGCIASS